MNAKGIFCILDALDECEGKGRSLLTNALCQLYDPESTESPPTVKFLLTSRPYDYVRRDFRILESRLPTIHLSGENEAEVDKICREIDIVINVKVDELGENLQLSQDERQRLQQELTRTPHRTYLWVYLVFDMISDLWSTCTTTDELRLSTRMLPRTVEAAYDKILCKSPNQEKAKQLLHIIVAAYTPLYLEEVELALAIRENHQTYTDLGLRGKDQFRKTVRELCGLFVTIVDSKVYLLHQTAREFLIKQQASDEPENPSQEIGGLRWKFSLNLLESHRILAKICIYYLLFQEFQEYPIGGKHALRHDSFHYHRSANDVFISYSATYWLTHWRLAQIRDDEPIQRLLFRLFDPSVDLDMTWHIIWTISG
ncbi:hypothetical protein F4781DRAFT_216045 [Annulohypoxylon bovei var. microspora]|nr:hypothetical protein F4781DRAFT_216045 [Annulohypoxylon bovei var. microspora]